MMERREGESTCKVALGGVLAVSTQYFTSVICRATHPGNKYEDVCRSDLV